ncbi:4'-phosphopantetheinyl transferase family protein [Nocardiopsis alborubida]|uniref:4'-phosphopantetheinyl transferase superfamily protein n=1 Tax=Nocardiopsis alborubida TaxID=146802 RepID=A0A7X6RPI1_9ACTN|nr:4'-phosphopantetheinyl transferase superfamily protein [Nocardiopsis alborubida]NKY97211.1 4'-phosphopantetheinyl transferase superfamily protein [Nocardiopsis alborubida]
MNSLVGAILPEDVLAVDSRGEAADTAAADVRTQTLERATPRRRREFAASRACAHTALTRLGFPGSPVGRSQDGAPRWPTGAVGSITHCAGYRAAAVARASEVAAVGIDAEPDGPLRAGLMEVIALPSERRHHRWLYSVGPAVHWDRLLLSAKESVYKAWYPLTGRWLDFADAELEFQPGSGTFTTRLDGAAVPDLAGRWLVTADGLVLTSAVVPASAGCARDRGSSLT